MVLVSRLTNISVKQNKESRNPEISPYTFRQLNFDKGEKVIQWRKVSVFVYGESTVTALYAKKEKEKRELHSPHLLQKFNNCET